VALAECCMMDRNEIHSATIDLTSWSHLPARALLFGEAQGRIVVSTGVPDAVLRVAAKHGVAARRIGVVEPAGRPFRVSFAGGALVAPIERLAPAYHDAIPSIMTRIATARDEDEPVSQLPA